MARFFVNRPIVAIVISIITVLLGGVAMQGLPIAQYPEVVPPMVLGLVTAVWTYVAWGENLVIAMGAYFTYQPIALFLESPMSWDFHEISSFLHI